MKIKLFEIVEKLKNIGSHDLVDFASSLDNFVK